MSLITVCRAADMIGISKRQLFKELVSHGVIVRCANGDGYLATQKGRAKDLIRIKLKPIQRGYYQSQYSQVLITENGLNWIQEHIGTTAPAPQAKAAKEAYREQ